MEIDEDELRQRVVGLLALAYREIHAEAPSAAEQATDSLLALSNDLTEYQFTFSGQLESRSDEAILKILGEAGDAAAKHVGEQMAQALASTLAAFATFCGLIEEEYPEVDLQPIIQELAARAASPQDAA